MKLIADSGSTKTEWVALSGQDIVASCKSRGINPVLQTFEEIALDLSKNVLPAFAGITIDEVFYYGAGCIPEKIEGMAGVLSRLFCTSSVVVCSDLVGAAVAACGNNPGIACILGTGSNSCFWDGAAIMKNVSPLGFILGDEGSGAVLGKTLIADILKNQLPEHITAKFREEFNLSPAEIIGSVYRQPFPNRFLAGFTRFMHSNLSEPAIRSIVLSSFTSFFRRNVMQYEYGSYPANFVGSVAFYFSDVLKEAAENSGVTVGNIVQAPMSRLIAYHSK